jgi:hypothetical protein
MENTDSAPPNYRGFYEIMAYPISPFPYAVVFRPYRGIPYATAAFELQSQAEAFAKLCNEEVRKRTLEAKP